MQTNQMLCEKIYETWGIDVPMEDIPGLISVNAIAAYLADAGDLARANAFREETLNMLDPTVTVSENYFLKK